ncbi:MAG: hypothetical protein K2W82_10750 [Candidatus Obscuribacterales bacterium]|nr:hypothetical protein [Candidatus Obscuribacterales bacterium]
MGLLFGAIGLTVCTCVAFATAHPFIGLFCASILVAGVIGFFAMNGPPW